MRLPCSQCKRTLFLRDFYETVWDGELLVLCSRECKDEWICTYGTQKESVLEEQTIAISPPESFLLKT
jgi:hypothetical protein